MGCTNNSKTSTGKDGRSELDGLDNQTSDLWFKASKIPSSELFLGAAKLNVMIDNPEGVAEVMSAVIGDSLVHVFA
jgi:hypothetical protein